MVYSKKMTKIKLVINDVRDLSAEDAAFCYENNLGPDGLMQESFEDCCCGEYNGHTIIAWHNNIRVGWCLIFEHENRFVFRPRTRYGRQKSSNTAMFWVIPKYRGDGIGKAMLSHASENFGALNVMPWKGQDKFFRTASVYISKDWHRGSPI